MAPDLVNLQLGNEALAFGAIAGGVRLLISHALPASAEFDLTLARDLPERGGAAVFVEDGEAALAAILGAGQGGTLGTTSVAGGDMARLPDLLAYAVERGVPALIAWVGKPVEAAGREESAGQTEIALIRSWAREGRGPLVLAPASPAECFDLARAGGALALRERRPVILYVDQVVAHLREPVSDAREDVGPPATVEFYRARDASVLVIAIGIVARAARTAVRLARERGLRAGLLRPVTLWPFPEKDLLEAASRCRTLLVAELNDGQLSEAVRALTSDGPAHVRPLADPSVGMWPPEALLRALEEAA